ncbi:Helicase associated domain protein [Arthrobacter psychrolactophilus]
MPGWEVSRHPEWEQMYAAGLTVREIADVVKRPRTTIQQHLLIRERYYIPGLRAAFEAARDAREPDWPTRQWHGRLDELAAFVTTKGRIPMIRHPYDAESSLQNWLRRQRELHQEGTLHPAKLAALNAAWPDWAGTDSGT